MNIEFERVTKKNRKKAYKIKVFKSQKNNIETVYKSLREARIYKCWKPTVIIIDGEYIGFIMYGFWKNEPPNGRVWLDRFMIDKNYQNKGYGKILMPLILDKLKKEYNCSKIYLSVYDNNKIAINFYKNFGFYFNGELDINGEKVMVKDLL